MPNSKRAELQAQIDAGADPCALGMTYAGSIGAGVLALVHPEIFKRIQAGKPITKRQGDRLKASPFLVQLKSV